MLHTLSHNTCTFHVKKLSLFLVILGVRYKTLLVLLHYYAEGNKRTRKTFNQLLFAYYQRQKPLSVTSHILALLDLSCFANQHND